MGGYEAPRKLGAGDDRSVFASGASEIDEWFRRFAYENQRANNATTYVTTGDGEVCGFYSIAVSAVDKSLVHAKFDRPSGPKQIPCILLARLAVSGSHQGQGIGVGLFKDSLERAALLSESVGARAVLIHARDESAKAFYQYLSEVYALPGNELHLMIPMKWIRANFLPH